MTPASLWAAFAESAARAPDATALQFPASSLTFGALKADAERVAAGLAARGLKKGDVVAIHLAKRREAYGLWLGCLRQGIVYAFLDPRNPAERSARVIDRLRPRVVVTTTRDGDVDHPHGDVVRLGDADMGTDWLGATDPVPPQADVGGDDPAYVMFTSGSTGEPKGAVIPHRGVLNLMRWVKTLIEPARERFSNVNPLHFDNSVFDLYCGLVSGATLVPVEVAALSNPSDWVKQLREGRATVIFAVPTWFLTLQQLRQLRPDRLPDARVFLFGGEGFPIESLRAFFDRFAPGARLVNVYGPTETSCICSSMEVTGERISEAGEQLLSLGRMHEGHEHMVLGPEGEIVPTGDTGELWIGGVGVGLGYYNNPEETGLRFRTNRARPGDRSLWYRSGDLVREDAQGWLWFRGRADNQVKIRGHRIELEEIDLVVEQIDGVERAVCVVVGGTEGPELRLAFVGNDDAPESLIRQQCEKRLPSYMRPARILRVLDLPRNANGKVDRRAVRAMMEQTS